MRQKTTSKKKNSKTKNKRTEIKGCHPFVASVYLLFVFPIVRVSRLFGTGNKGRDKEANYMVQIS